VIKSKSVGIGGWIGLEEKSDGFRHTASHKRSTRDVIFTGEALEFPKPLSRLRVTIKAQ
jgi:hypothetical protein